MSPTSGVFLLGSCIAAVAARGSVFELSSGTPDLGNLNTSIILALSIPVTVLFFVVAVKDTRANMK